MTREQQVYLLPVCFEEALILWGKNIEIYSLRDDNTEALIEDLNELLTYKNTTAEDRLLAVQHEDIRKNGSVRLDIVLDVFNDFGKEE